MKTPRHFRDALDCFPPEAAAELLDHLEEARQEGLQAGLDAAQAERRALDSLGDLTKLRSEMETATACAWWVRRNLSLRQRLLASGWLALGLYLMSGICTHPDPDYMTIIGSLGLGLCCVVMGVGLLRWHDQIRLWVTGSAVLLGVVFLSLLGLSFFEPDVPMAWVLAPPALVLATGFVATSVWSLHRRMSSA